MKKIINYSGIPALILMAALVFMPFSCSKEAVKENPLTDNSSQLIKISGEDVSVATKTTLSGLVTSWVITDDKVGIYCAQARTTSGGSTAIVNAQFTAASTGTSSNFTGTMYWGAANPHIFYAYYPYAGSAGSPAATAVPVSLATAQTQSAANNSAHIGALDFMVATPVTVTSPGGSAQISNTAVHLSYNHLFTVLEFQITGSGTLNAVKLSSTSKTVAFSGGTIDLNQTPTAAPYTFATQTGTTTQAVVTLTTPATITGTVQKVYMVINPSTASENYYIGFLSGSTWTYITKLAPDGGFLRGKKYVVAISTTGAGAAPSGAPIDPAIDVDGNAYTTVTINTQTWMASNLKTTKYNDGTAITNVTDNAAWAGLITGAFCYYSNNVGTNYGATYGALYNWYAVDNNASTKVASNGGKNLCPVGWHVPTDTEWTTLTGYLTTNFGTSLNAAKALAAKTNWSTSDIANAVGNNLTINNSSGFTALPGGYRGFGEGNFYNVGNTGYWWSSTAGAPYPWTRALEYNYATVYSNNSNPEKFGVSVRCMRD